MRRWGVIVTASYALLLLTVVFPAGLVLFSFSFRRTDFAQSLSPLVKSLSVYLTPWPWVVVAVLAACQALLLFLSVDTTFRRLRPRRHIAVTIVLTSFFAALLFSAGLLAFSAGVYGDVFESAAILALPGFWLVWAVLFYLHLRGSPHPVSTAIAWLLKGSVMELLIAVPAHVAARQREDCSAPIVTSFGIVTGIAVMLFAFGPGVLALYKKRYDAYRRPRAAVP